MKNAMISFIYCRSVCFVLIKIIHNIQHLLLYKFFMLLKF